MGDGLARAITIGSIVLTVASLSVAVIFARKASRIRIGFDVARAAVGVIAILVMAAITNVTTPLFSVFLAIAGGLALGFGQGSNLEVTSNERGLHSKRSPIGIALWGAGIVVMQAAGIASRTGMVKLGQTMAWFSVCLGVGLLVGRNGPLRNANRAVAGGGAAMLLAVLVLPTVAFVGGAPAPAAADTPQLTDDEVCDLLVPETSDLLAAANTYDPLPGRDFPDFTTRPDPLTPVGSSIAACRQLGYENYCGFSVDYTVYHFPSEREAVAQFNAETAAVDEVYAFEWERALEWFEVYPTGEYGIGTGPLDEFGVVGSYWITGFDQRVIMTTGPFMLYGVAEGDCFEYGEVRADRSHEPDRYLVETLITPMADTVRNIEAYLARTAPPPPEPVDEETTTSVGVAEPDDDDSASETEDTQQDQDTALPPVTDGSGETDPSNRKKPPDRPSPGWSPPRRLV